MSIFDHRVNCRAVSFLLVAGLTWMFVADSSYGQAIKRVQPNAQAKRVGSAIAWEASLATARKKSAETGKPILWYVYTVPGTFMDRRTEIDRYVLGGPFSWPPIIDMVNQQFVPLKVKPGKEAASLGIVPYKFIEPGLVILAGEKVALRLDRLTTFHYDWLLQRLADGLSEAGVKFEMKKPSTDFDSARFQVLAGDSETWVDPVKSGQPASVSDLLLSGMMAFRKGDHQTAQARWESASKQDPEHPLAHKAALEAQGLGPFYRGFEVYGPLPKAVMNVSVENLQGSAASPEAYSQSQLLTRSAAFLLGMQRSDGAFVDSDYDFGGTDSLPNVHVAVTSLVGMALIKLQSQHQQAAGVDAAKLESAISRAITYVSKNENINPADRDEILWAHGFRLRFLARRIQSGKNDQKLKTELAEAIDDLQNIQLKTGNWYHEYNNPFVTATALCALYEASQAGGKIDQEKIKKGTESLLRDRYPNGSYPYYSAKSKKRLTERQLERSKLAAAGRMPICELALVRWGKLGQKELTAALDVSLKNHHHLASGYKYDNHTSNMAYGGFFFWYDMRGRSEAIRAVENQALRQEFAQKQRSIWKNLPEIDGCFIDSHELGRCYGTAMAILSIY